MDRISYIEVAGKKYPLSLSLGATKEICNKFGSMKEMQKALSDTENLAGLIDTLTYVMEVLIRQGCAYINAFGKYLPKEKDLAVDEDGKCVPITQELLEVYIDFNNAPKLIEAVVGALGLSQTTEIEAESKEKNAEAPQEA